MNMEISTQVREAHRRLGAANERFLDFIAANPQGLTRAHFNLVLKHPEVASMPIQPWPTLISQEFRKQAQEAALKTFQLIKSIPRKVFAWDMDKMAQWYVRSPKTVRSIFRGVDDDYIHHLLGRGDFVLGDDGFKCLEYNVQGNLGGSEVDLLESLLLNVPVVNRFFNSCGVTLHNNRFFTILLSTILDRTLKRFTNKDEALNMAVAFVKLTITPNNPTEMVLAELYRQLLQSKAPGRSGRLFLGELSHMVFKEGNAYFQDKTQIRVLLELCNGYLPAEIKDVLERRNLVLYNGHITHILADKLNLALLSELGDQNSPLFSDEERDTIKKYIPWTRKIEAKETEFKGKNMALDTFIRNHREQLVIKPGDGMGGRDIFVGKNTPQEKWEKITDKAVAEKNWVVQEFVDSGSYLYQYGPQGCVPCKTVWGFFMFGESYAGAFLRALPETHDAGVINTHQGAEKSVVLETDI